MTLTLPSLGHYRCSAAMPRGCLTGSASWSNPGRMPVVCSGFTFNNTWPSNIITLIIPQTGMQIKLREREHFQLTGLTSIS